MRHALVTGATGQVGAYLVERLVADGWRVRALVRSPADAAWLEALGAALVPGDVLEAARLREAAAGCEAVFHAAAAVTARGGWEIYRTANIEGTRNAIAAAEAAGAKLLHVSSVAVYGGTRYREAPTGEDSAFGELPDNAHYARSKRESEQLVMRAHAEERLWACAVRPDVIYGRHDRQFIPRIAGVIDRGLFPVFEGGRSLLAMVHAASVADGAVRAVDIAAAGGRAYNLANDFDVTVKEFAALASVGLGHRVVCVPVPIPVAVAGFRVMRWVVRLARGASMSRDAANILSFMTRGNPFTSERARRELGWSPPVRPEQGIPEAFRWWKERRRRA